MLVKLAAHGTHFLQLPIQGLVFLALVEFPEVLLLGLVNDAENTGGGFVENSSLGELESWPRVSLATCG